jgi:hypothetical protein
MIRALNIAFRSLHLAAMGVLLGGHAFQLPPERLHLSLWLTLGTGAALAALETGGKLLWFHQGRGLMTLLKLALLGTVPLVWDHRLPILLAVVIIASVGSHMPSRYRYYSVVHRRVIHDPYGPGSSRARETEAAAGVRPGV